MLRAVAGSSAGAPAAFVAPQAYTWATKPAAASSTGMLIRITDVGGGTTNVGGGTHWFSNGTRWKLVNSSGDIDTIDTANAGTANTTPQNLNPNAATVQAGVINANDRIILDLVLSKSGGADTATFAIRLGSLFTATDAALGTITLTTEQSARVQVKWKRTGSNTIQRQGPSVILSSFGGATGVFPTAVTLNGADAFDTTAMRLGLWQTMTGGTEFVTVQDLQLALFTTDS